MPTSLIYRLQKLEQYQPLLKRIVWQDSTATRWANVYGKLDVGYPAIALSYGKVLLGEVESIQPNVSVTIKNVKEFAISNDDFLRIAEISPENISTVKANFHPFISYLPINFIQFEKDLEQKNFISFYIVYESSVSKVMPMLKPNDRVVLVKPDGTIFWMHQYKFNQLQNLDNFRPELFGSRGMVLEEVKRLHVASGKKNNILAVERMIEGLRQNGYFKFKTFTEYYNIIHNKRLYKNIPEEGELDDEILESISNTTTMDQALNTILYGPPGTGKTYNSISKAVEIASPDFNLTTASRAEVKTEYDKLVKEGFIEFVTFHQSMSYEDFIEGIKPVKPEPSDPFLKYEVQDGIFKRIAQRATLVPQQAKQDFSITETAFANAGFYKISLGDTSSADDDVIYNWCIANGYIALGWGDAIDFTGKTEGEIQKMVPNNLDKYEAQAVNYFIHYLKLNDYVVVTYGNLKFRAIGKVTGSYEFKNIDGLRYHQFRKVEWLVKDLDLPYELIYNKQFSQQSIYRLDRREIKKEYFVKDKSTGIVTDNKPKNYVLIIDEINRGNVSQIFGELITLIEADKRHGNAEALNIVLPYSKQVFSVPSNLYIIGTMNTADRSVEALDTALRRRFVFEEMMPNASLVQELFENEFLQVCTQYHDLNWEDKEWTAIEEGFNELLPVEAFSDFKDLISDNHAPNFTIQDYKNYWNQSNIITIPCQLLQIINQRIALLLNRDSFIGHAYFIGKYTWESLGTSFYKNIIPLLQEYFYGDYGKIGLVLGEGFIRAINRNPKSNILANFDYDDSAVLEEKKIYEIVDYRTEKEYKLKYNDADILMDFSKAISLLLNNSIE